jgi:hypothetical protein
MRLLIVIVNYRTASLVIDCLRSLAPEVAAVPGTRVVVTDNQSPDDSVARLRAAVAANGWSDWCEIRPLERNGGFAYGNNGGIKPALESGDPPQYVLLLNPDTVVHAGALKSLVDFMDGRPDVGIAGSRLEHPDGKPQRSAFRFPTALSEFENALRLGLVTKLLSRYVVARPVPGEACETDWVSGASFLVRREVFRDVGLLDDGYFMYFEETDFCLAARRKGWKVWHVPASRVVHLIGQASGFNDGRKPTKPTPKYWFDSRRRYFVKNHGRVYAMLADGLWTVGFFLWRVRRRLQRKPDQDPPRFMFDFLRYSTLAQAFRL